MLENVAVGPLHTPRLYSTFLKAVIASKTGATVNGEGEPFDSGESSEPPTSPSINTSPAASIQSPHLQQQQHAGLEMISPNLPSGELAPPVPAPPPTNGMFSPYDYYPFQNDGEMGPAVDITTFPPTMAEQEQAWPSLSVDNIFSNGFWDNVLVPGASCFIARLLSVQLCLLVVTLPGTSGSPAGLCGGFAYGPGVSGLITPGFGTPVQSGQHTPHHTSIPSSADMMQSHAHQMVLDPRQQDVRC